MITIIYKVNKDDKEYKDIFDNKISLNQIVESLQRKHGNDYSRPDIYLVNAIVNQNRKNDNNIGNYIFSK